jgi:hypothetical protein
MTTYSTTHGGLERIAAASANAQALAGRASDAVLRGLRGALARWQAAQQARANSRALELIQNMFAHDPALAAEFRAALLRSE